MPGCLGAFGCQRTSDGLGTGLRASRFFGRKKIGFKAGENVRYFAAGVFAEVRENYAPGRAGGPGGGGGKSGPDGDGLRTELIELQRDIKTHRTRRNSFGKHGETDLNGKGRGNRGRWRRKSRGARGRPGHRESRAVPAPPEEPSLCERPSRSYLPDHFSH